jgi:hypothetical protein
MRINKIDMSHVNSTAFSNVFNQTIKILLAKYSHLSIYNVLHFTEISNLLISQHN